MYNSGFFHVPDTLECVNRNRGTFENVFIFRNTDGDYKV